MWKTCLNIISPIQSHLFQIWSGKIVTLMLQNGQTTSTKWRLGENVVLRLMECLTPTVGFDIFTVHYFTSFRIFNHLGVNFIRAARVLIKNRLCKWKLETSSCVDSCKSCKRNVAILRARIKQKSIGTRTAAVRFEQLHVNLANLRDLFGVGTKLKKNISRTVTNQYHYYNQNMGFLNRMDQNLAKYWYPNEKMVVVLICLNDCYSGCVGIVSC